MFLFSLETVALLLAMAIPGFLIAKTKLINNSQAISVISVLLLYVCQPFVTVHAFLNTTASPAILINVAAVFVIATILYVALIFIGKAIFFWEKDLSARGIFAYAGTFGNAGYMCIPFLQILMPGNTEIILYASSAVVAFNLVAWSLGSYTLTGDKSFIKIKKIIFNPPTLTFILVLPLFIFNINFVRFPALQGIGKIASSFNNLIGPLAMTLLGIKFAEMPLKLTFLDRRVYIASAVKLILSPVIALCLTLLAGLFMDISAIRLNVIAVAAMPSATNLMMFTALFKKDTALAARLTLISTLLSIVTVPLALEFLL